MLFVKSIFSSAIWLSCKGVNMFYPTIATGTPLIGVIDNRGLTVRALNWNREQSADPLRLLVSHSYVDDASRVASHRDPRQFAAWSADDTAPSNLRTTPSLTGQVLRRESSDSGERVTLSDAAGRAVWMRDGRGTVQTMTYDELGRPSSGSEQLSGSSEIRVSWRSEYGDSGPADDGSQGNNLRGVCVTQYDSGGLLRAEAVALSGAVLSQGQRFLASAEVLPDWPEEETGRAALLEAEIYTTTVTADARGAVLDQTDAAGHAQAWRYDVSGAACHQTVTPAGGETQALLDSVTRSAAGRVLTESAGNGVTTTYGYDPQNQWLASITARRTDNTTLQALSYGYDFTGNVTSLTDGTVATGYWCNQATDGGRSFTYDALYQLLSASGRENAGNTGMQYSALPAVVPDGSQSVRYSRSYHYDDSGNLTSLSHTGAGSYTRTMTTDTTSNRSVQQNDGGPQTPEEVAGWFDSNGNLLTLQAGATGTDGLLWDGSDNLQQVTLVSRSPDSSRNDREVYQYSGSRRVRRQTRTLVNSSRGLWDVDEVRYLPGLELRKSWQETAGSSAAPSLTEELHVVTGQAGRAGIRMLYWESGKPDGIDNNQVRWRVDDNIGSLSLELDGGGGVISREEYYPFGGTAVWAAQSEVEASYKTVRYSGKERDGTGLYYYGHRYYAPWLCRWVSADPAGEVDGLNLFRMVRNNPVTLKDADGRQPTAHDQIIIDHHASRARFPSVVTTYQEAFSAVYNAHGVEAYNDLWNFFNNKIPLNSTSDITPGDMEKIADFIEKREIISGMIYSSTTPSGIVIDETHAKWQLYNLPLNILKKAKELGQFVTLTNDNVTNHPGRQHLKGVTPRGHAGTWDTVPGVGAQGKYAPKDIHGDETVVAMNEVSPGEWRMASAHTSTNLILHEFAHAIDRSFGEKANLGSRGLGEAGDYLSRRQSFRHVWIKDLSHTASGSTETYYWQEGNDGGAEEAFAEGMSDLYGGTNHRNWPNVKSYISAKMETIN